MFCYQCGAENGADVRFCAQCGIEQPQTASKPDSAGKQPAGMASYLPQFERTSDNGLSQAEAERDRIYAELESLMETHRAEIQILKSGPYEALPWVHAEAWVPHPTHAEMMFRRTLKINVRPCSFQRFPIERDVVFSEVRFNDVLKEKKFVKVIELPNTTIEQFFLYLIAKRERGMREFSLVRARCWGLDLWRPVNRPVLLKRFNLYSIGLSVLFYSGAMTVAFYGLGVVILLITAALWWHRKTSPAYTIKSGFPERDPRDLLRLDSWQTVVNQLGHAKEQVRREIVEELDLMVDKAFHAEVEKIPYIGLRGKEEREQLVIGYKRAMTFVHIYQYENDLFVGWDAHLNKGIWGEKTIAAGEDKVTHNYCRLVVPDHSTQQLNEYDITDANCLIERLHAAVTRVLRRQIAHYRIDQEVDFSILRERRGGVADPVTKQKEAGKGSLADTLKDRFKRKG